MEGNREKGLPLFLLVIYILYTYIHSSFRPPPSARHAELQLVGRTFRESLLPYR